MKTKVIMAMMTNLLETNIVQFHKATFEWWYGARENIPSKDPKNDSEKEDLRINLEEEEEEGGDTGYEDGQGECKDYSSTLAHDLLDDRFYLDDDDSTDKFNSSQNDVRLSEIF
ncbi:hypothetical protein V1477_001491 [Vespula maculifrons]|uniref:Uncharacterized protein n=1 Tax=Vespula maculifrons TaxID=7453 RepID=A0ABD2CYX7_VESMC